MTRFASILALSSFLLAACEDHTEGVTAAEVTTEAAPADPAPSASARETLRIDRASSSVGFTGAKVTDSHTGTFGEFDGTIALDPRDATASSVRITIQMASVQIEPERLLGHLKSEDFFAVEQHPTAVFESVSIRAGGEGTVEGRPATHTITGNLTLRGTTRAITFPAIVEVTPSGVSAKSEFKIDRTSFGIVYPGMANDLISDDVVIRFDVRAPRGES